jgi:DNA gyrase subunit A
LAVTAQGQALRTPLAPYRTASNKLGRRYMRLDEGDRVVLATVLRNEKTLFLASAAGHVIHFPVDQINILSGAGKGVMGIKLDKDDSCLGGLAVSARCDTMQVENNNGTVLNFSAEKYETTSRAGKCFEGIKRGHFVRVLPPPIELVDWDELEGKKNHGSNGKQKTLFE